MAAGNLSLAEAAFLKATRNSGNAPEPFYYLGLSYSRQGKHAEAVAAFEEALSRDPKSPAASTLLGISHYRLGDQHEAQRAFEEGLRQDSRDSSALFFLGLLHQEAGRCGQAIPLLERARRDANFEQVAYFNIGICHRKSGREEAAKRALEQAVDSDPNASIAQDARDLLEAYGHVRPQRRDKRWSVAGSVGFSYDDNVVQDDLDVDSETADVLGLFEFSPSLRIFQNESSELEIGYDLFQSLHAEEDDFDFQTNSIYLDASHEYRQVDFGLGYRWSHSTLDGDDFLTTHSLRPSVAYAFLPEWYAQMGYSFQDRDFDLSRRDASAHGFFLENYYFIQDRKGHLRLGYRVVGEDAKGAEFDNIGHFFTAGVRFDAAFMNLPRPVFSRLDIGLHYKFASQEYGHRTPSIGEKRDDTRHGFELELTRRLSEFLALHLDYEFTQSNSNLPSADYSQNIVTFRVGAEF